MNYDQWKQETPYEDEDLTKECAMCDAPIEPHRTYCSRQCRNADD